MRRKPDEVDFLCMDWAVPRRKILGIITLIIFLVTFTTVPITIMGG